MPNIKTTLFLILPLIISAALGLVLLEGLVRWKIGSPLEQRLPLVSVTADPEAGWRMVPNDQHYTYQHFVQLNSLGFRGPEPQAKAVDEYRIIALGGSNLYGQGLADQELMSTLIAGQLNNAFLDCQVSVINMGVRAYGIRSELAVLKGPGLSLKPDHVVLFFYINDFAKVNIEESYDYYSKFDSYLFDLKGQATEKQLSNWQRIQFFGKSAALNWLYYSLRTITQEKTVDLRVLQGVVDAEIQQGMINVDESLKRLVVLSKEHDFSVSIVALPEPRQSRVDFPDEAYQSRLAEYAERNTIDFFDLLPTLKFFASDQHKRIVFPFDGHHNAKVQQEFANKIADYLADNQVDCKNKQALN
jgi:hypothetical protein